MWNVFRELRNTVAVRHAKWKRTYVSRTLIISPPSLRLFSGQHFKPFIVNLTKDKCQNFRYTVVSKHDFISFSWAPHLGRNFFLRQTGVFGELTTMCNNYIKMVLLMVYILCTRAFQQLFRQYLLTILRFVGLWCTTIKGVSTFCTIITDVKYFLFSCTYETVVFNKIYISGKLM